MGGGQWVSLYRMHVWMQINIYVCRCMHVCGFRFIDNL